MVGAEVISIVRSAACGLIDFDGEFAVPVARVATVELIERDLFTSSGVERQFGKTRRPDVDDETARADHAGWNFGAQDHEAAGLGLDGGGGCGGGVAEGDDDGVVAFGNLGGELEGLVAGGGVAVVAGGNGCAGLVAVAGGVVVDRGRRDAGEARLRTPGAGVECEEEMDGRGDGLRRRVDGRLRGLRDRCCGDECDAKEDGQAAQWVHPTY